MGNRCEICKTAYFGGEPYLVTLEDDVRITRGVEFITHDGALWAARRAGIVSPHAARFGKILVKQGTHIGWNTIIMPGVTIGKYCVIGAGSVVTKDVPDYSVAAGVPARVIETLEEYVEKTMKRDGVVTEDTGKGAFQRETLERLLATEETNEN